MIGQQVTTAEVQARLERIGRRVWSWSMRTGPLRPIRMTRGDWAYIAAIYLLSRAAIVVIGLAGSAMFPSVGLHNAWVLQPITLQTLSRWPNLFAHFDSGWYIQISHGYPKLITGSSEPLRTWGFLPGYPMALHVVAIILTIIHTPGPVDVVAGTAVSYAASFGASVYLFLLAGAELERAAARRAVTYLLVFPTSLFLSAVYPEGLLLLATTGAFYHARRRQWLPAGLLSAVAVITHSEGVLALAPVTLEFLAYYSQAGGWRQRNFLKLSWLLGPPLATLGAYALYSHSHTGYWLAFATSQNVVWGHHLSPPIYPFIGFLLHPGIGSAFDFDFHLLNILIALLALVLAVVAFRRLPPSYGLAILLGVLLPLSTDGSHTHSLARHVGSLFALFVALAAWSLRERWSPSSEVEHAPASTIDLEIRDRAVLVPSLLALALFTLMFTAGVWAAI
jgi:hypothetical protein